MRSSLLARVAWFGRAFAPAGALVLAFAGTVRAADGGPAPTAGESPICAWQPSASDLDSASLACTLPRDDRGRQFRVVARFAGSHDDTRLSLTVTSNDAPVACAHDDKTVSQGEDGDGGEISLQCRFAAEPAPLERVVVARIAWSHARPEALTLTPLP